MKIAGWFLILLSAVAVGYAYWESEQYAQRVVADTADSFELQHDQAQVENDRLKIEGDTLELQIDQAQHRKNDGTRILIDKAKLRGDELALSLQKERETLKPQPPMNPNMLFVVALLLLLAGIGFVYFGNRQHGISAQAV